MKRPYSITNAIKNYEEDLDSWKEAHRGCIDSRREVLLAESFRRNPEDAFLVLIEASPDSLPKLLMNCFTRADEAQLERSHEELFEMILEANRAAYRRLSDSYVDSEYKNSHWRAG